MANKDEERASCFFELRPRRRIKDMYRKAPVESQEKVARTEREEREERQNELEKVKSKEKRERDRRGKTSV